MAQFDMPLEKLERYRPVVPEPENFLEFWALSLHAARELAQPTSVERVDAGLTTVVVDDVTFSGFGGQPIKAWLRRPVLSTARKESVELPVIVEYLGYGGGRGLPHESLTWASAGFAHLIMDTRGQGGHWGSGGDTPDPDGRSVSAAGWVTAGIDDPHDHFYRRFYIDAARAVDAVRELPGLDANRVTVLGTSQGGGAAIAATALQSMVGTPPWAAMPNVPFMQDLRRAVEIVDSNPYRELTQYLSVRRSPGDAEQAWHTMSYLDGVNFAQYADAPALYSVALMDETCPPSTVFASYNAWGEKVHHQSDTKSAVEKQIDVYPYNNHEGGQEYRFPAELAWLATLGAAS